MAIELELRPINSPFDPEKLRRAQEISFWSNINKVINGECPLNFPTPCSMLDGGPFGELAQAELEGLNLKPYIDIKEIADKCTECRIFVEECKEGLRFNP